VLIDGAAFFGTLRRALLKAQRSVFIAGWDIDSRTRLVSECEPDDGYPAELADFLTSLVNERPALHVHLLLWDYSIVYAAERELFPRIALEWKTPERVTFCLDDALPVGSSQHQKLVTIDDALAFSGGLDLTQRRWDATGHKIHDTRRVDSDDDAYGPFHDVQMMVDGDAARALAELTRQRWCHADRKASPVTPFGDPWPDETAANFEDVTIGIARTQPEFRDQGEIREVQQLFIDSIAAAERSIYIENQFITAPVIADAIAKRLRERPQLEVLAVAPRRYKSKVVSSTLGDDRYLFLQRLREAGGERVRLVYPSLQDGRNRDDHARAATMVHSKVMIVDDCILRVGSANLNNRSMGADTECDLVVEASNDRQRRAIVSVRNRLLADHCGTSPDQVASAWEQNASLLALADKLSGNGHRLIPVEDQKAHHSPAPDIVKHVIDPERPLTLGRLWERLTSRLPPAGVLGAPAAIILAALALAAAWRFTSLAEFVTRERAQEIFSAAQASAWAPLLVLATYLMAGTIAFPVLILIAATAAVFGPWVGFLYAASGSLLSALAMYGVGRLAGPRLLKAIAGPRWTAIQEKIARRGVLAVAAVRLVPVAPFTVVNLAAGACSIRLTDYLLGTLIGMLPGLILIAALGHQLTSIFTDFSAVNLAIAAGLLLMWVALAWTAQALSRHGRNS